MSRDSNVLQFRQPDAIDDPLNELARGEGARRNLGPDRRGRCIRLPVEGRKVIGQT